MLHLLQKQSIIKNKQLMQVYNIIATCKVFHQLGCILQTLGSQIMMFPALTVVSDDHMRLKKWQTKCF